MTLSKYAERRLRERFPDLGEHVLLAHWLSAQGRRPTPAQTLAIRRRCRRLTPGRRYLVSTGGIVFVVGDGDVVVTIFEVPRIGAVLTDAERRRLRFQDRLAADRAADAGRRERERRTCWRRLLEDD